MNARAKMTIRRWLARIAAELGGEDERITFKGRVRATHWPLPRRDLALR